MFKNYHELFLGYVEFYRTSLFASDQQDEQHTGAKLSFANKPLHYVFNSKFNNSTLIKRYQQDQLMSPNTGRLEPPKLFKTIENRLLSINAYLVGDEAANQHTISREHGPRLGSRSVNEDGVEITIGSFNRLHAIDVFYVLTTFVCLWLIKRVLVNRLRNSTNIDRYGLRPKDRERIEESVWRLTFYSFSSAWLIYVCFIKNNSYLLFSATSPFPGYSFNVDWSSYTICMIESAFYLHATYALLFEDVWRRDSPMMLVHHIAAAFSIVSLYATRTHQIGLASTVLRDTCDVLLEVTKLIKCFHIQHGKRVKSLMRPLKICLAVFAFAFAVNQLYYYPLFCIYHGLNMIKVHRLQTPVMVGILTCALIFLLLDLLWFLLILRLLYFMLISKDSAIKDVREYDDEEMDIVSSDINQDEMIVNAKLTSKDRKNK